MNDGTATWVWVVGVLISGIILDIMWAFFNSTPNSADTISGVLRRAGRYVPGVAFAWGVLGGHFWIGAGPLPWGAAGPGALAVAAALISIGHRWRGLSRRWFLAWLLAGIAGGAWLWPQ